MIELRGKLDLDKQEMDSCTVLIHGGYGAGKTHFLGDALLTEQKTGPVCFLNIQGEDGTMTLKGKGIENAANIISIKDYEEALTLLHKHKLQALAVDSLKALVRMVMEDAHGGAMPEKTDYMIIHWTMDRLVKSLRKVAKWVICACPSDKSVDQLTGQTWTTPDLPGREAMGSAGWFDFVGYMTATAIGPGKVKRGITFSPNGAVLTRQRLPKLIPDIPVPTGGGGWMAFRQAVEKAIAVEKGEGK